MIKKILITFFVFIAWFWYANAEIVEYTDFPLSDSMINYQELVDKGVINVNTNFSNNWILPFTTQGGEITAVLFCQFQGWGLLEYTTGTYYDMTNNYHSDKFMSSTSGYAFYFSQAYNVLSSRTSLYKTITCEFPEPETIILESDKWINKPIFDEDTLKEYYAYKAGIMFLVLFFMFFKRLLDRKNNKLI